MKYLPLVLIVLFFSCSTSPKNSGSPAVEIELEGSYHTPDNTIPTLEQLKGKVVVLDFWATWCSPCISGFPKFQSLYETYRNKGVAFIAITDDSKERVENFLSHSAYTFWVGHDTDHSTLKDYNVKGIPLYVVINKEGNVVCRTHSLSEEIITEVLKTGWYQPKKEISKKSKPTNTMDMPKLSAIAPGQDPAYVFAYDKKYNKRAPFAEAYSFVIRPTLYDSLIGNFFYTNGESSFITYPYCSLLDFLEISQDKSSSIWIENQTQDSLIFYDVIYNQEGKKIEEAIAEIEKEFLELTHTQLVKEKRKKKIQKLVLDAATDNFSGLDSLPSGTNFLYQPLNSLVSYLEKTSKEMHIIDNSLMNTYIPKAPLRWEKSIEEASYEELKTNLKHLGIEIQPSLEEIELIVIRPKT